MDKTYYVAGFVFNEAKTQVMLIQKNKPDWQKGRLNGIGGHVEQGEGSFEAMQRECQEECGLAIALGDWRCFVSYEFLPAAHVDFFFAVADLSKIECKTDEIVGAFPVSTILNGPVIETLRWLVPLALFCMQFKLNMPLKVIEHAVDGRGH